jgi:hypothetical protein
MTVSFDLLVTLTSRYPSSLMVPAKTVSPTLLVTAILSPVIAA